MSRSQGSRDTPVTSPRDATETAKEQKLKVLTPELTGETGVGEQMQASMCAGSGICQDSALFPCLVSGFLLDNTLPLSQVSKCHGEHILFKLALDQCSILPSPSHIYQPAAASRQGRPHGPQGHPPFQLPSRWPQGPACHPSLGFLSHILKHPKNLLMPALLCSPLL